MREATITVNVYKYEELSAKAKEHAKTDYLDTCRTAYEFSEICEESLSELFPHSSLRVEYSLSFCQGDGLNIYGVLDLEDALMRVMPDLTEEEQYILTKVLDKNHYTYRMRQNGRYSYCICDRHYYVEDLIPENEDEAVLTEITKSDIGDVMSALAKFNDVVRKNLVALCGKFERMGYDYFYTVTDNEMIEISDANGWEYTADGKFFYD